MIDEKNYTVTWVTGRRGCLTRQQAIEYAAKIEDDWRRFGCRGRPEVAVWYRDGSRLRADERLQACEDDIYRAYPDAVLPKGTGKGLPKLQ